MLGERIRQRRKELGFSLRKLGARTGLTASFLSQVEHNQSSPSITSLQRIATALEVPVIALFDGRVNPALQFALVNVRSWTSNTRMSAMN